MATRRLASRLLFGSACLLLGGALAMLVTSWILPAQSMEDLGRVVGAMLLAAVAAIPFALSLLVGRGTKMPRWMVATAIGGAVLGLVPGIAILSARFG